MSYRFDSIPVLETERTILRQLLSSDANEIYLLRSDEKINEFIDRPIANSIEDGINFINKIKVLIDKGGSFYWTIELKTSPKLAGTVALWNIDKEANRIEIGYELLPQHHGKGIMHEVVERVLDFAFTTLGFTTVEGWVQPGNERSIKLIEKLGFKRDAKAEKERKQEDMKEIVYSFKRKHP
jgi:ribosomal-protein-alanine N-acetyltransferase